MALNTPIKRSQYAQKVSDQFNERVVFHFETDTKQVLVGDSNQTLDELLSILDGQRSITLTGEVTGSVQTDGHSGFTLETTVTPDGHEHTGATVKVGEAGRVVVSAEDRSIIVSNVTTTELGALTGIKDNIQTQLDNKVQASAENGHILLDGKDLPVYVHPDGVNYEESILDPIDLDSHKKILSVKNFTVDQGGHISALELQTYNMPMISKFWVSNIEPTGQVVGDFWIETLNVEVESGAFYLQPAGENPNLADTMVVGAATTPYFTLTDPVTEITTPSGEANDYSLSEVEDTEQ